MADTHCVKVRFKTNSLEVYQNKDSIEKCFDDLKTDLDYEASAHPFGDINIFLTVSVNLFAEKALL